MPSDGRIADYIFVIESGKISLEGTAKALRAKIINV